MHRICGEFLQQTEFFSRKTASNQTQRVPTPPARKRESTPPNPEDEHVFVPLAPVLQREATERKQIKIELAKAVPLPPSVPPPGRSS